MAKARKKSQAKPHKVFLVPELLEMILLEVDTRTLLMSAQRVCHFWYEVICNSSNLQAALFFKPVAQPPAPGSERIRNPLLDGLWREFFHSKIQSTLDQWPDEWSRTLPMMKRKREEAYTRTQASWKRMLLHQPPEFHLMCFIIKSEHRPVDLSDIKTTIIPEEDGLVRMEHIAHVIRSGVFTPCRVPWTFALKKWSKKSLDRAERTGIWDTRHYLLSQSSIVAFHWPAKFERENHAD